jgi:hypothetical protein
MYIYLFAGTAGNPVRPFISAVRTDLLSNYTWLKFWVGGRMVRPPPPPPLVLWATRQPSFVKPLLLSRPFTGLKVLRTVPPLPPASTTELHIFFIAG